MVKRREIEDTDQSVEGVCGMARLLGYKDRMHQLQNSDGSYVGDLLLFLEDNPGAIEAMVQWVLDEGRTADGDELEDEDGDDIEDASL